MRRLKTCLVSFLLLSACSSSKSNDFYEKPGDNPGTSTVSGTTTLSSGVSTTTSGTATSGATTSGTSTTGQTSTSGGTSSTSSASGSGATTGTATSGAATTGDDASTSDDGGTGGSSVTSTTAGDEPDEVMVDVELEPGTDCVEVSCPDEAPYAVACEITFSDPGPLGFACVATEPDGVLYVQSGTTCYGNQIDSGSITCSSQMPAQGLSTASCVAHNKPNFSVVEDRCDCEGEVPGCPGFN